MKVTHYTADTNYVDSGSTTSLVYPFLPEHGNLDGGGIPVKDAMTLISEWNKKKTSSSIRCRFSLTVDDMLKFHSTRLV